MTNIAHVHAGEDYAALEARLIQAARDLRPQLIAEQAQTEQNTYFSEDLHHRFEEAGLYRMLIPQAHGGLEVTPRTYFRVAKELARGDMSAAWCFTLSANHALMVANWFPEQIHAEVFDGGDFRAASMYAPTVTAAPCDGGWQLDGVANYCSGIPYSTYFIGAARLPGNNPDGSPRVGTYLVPRSEYEILNDWGNMHGLNGSGSHSIRLDNGWVPATHLLEDVDMNFYGVEGDSPGSLAYGNPMYSGRHTSTFTISLAALTIGGSLGALDEYENLMRSRRTTLPPFVPRLEDPDFQRWYGSASVKLATAEAALDNVLDQWLELAEGNVRGTAPFTLADDVRLAGIARELLLQAWEVVDKDLYRTVGSAASQRGERFERVFRDVAQAAGHRNAQLREPLYRILAQQQLGLIP